LSERQIRFVRDDFEPFFEAYDVKWDSLTDDEWRSFENMFMSGIQWSEVADIAASTVAYERKGIL
jgi:hypothetical protein